MAAYLWSRKGYMDTKIRHSLPLAVSALYFCFSIAANAGPGKAEPVHGTFGSTVPPQAVPEKLPAVLPPGQFFGAAAMGYAAAKTIPEVCHKLFCYCGCDITDDHKNLLDCFVTVHGADCHICQEEALLALKMKRLNKPLAAIQKAVDQKYTVQYPFSEESPYLQTYKKKRLWTEGNKPGSASGAKGKKASGCCFPGKVMDSSS